MVDLVIRNATIYDGSGDPCYRGDIAVKEGIIVAVGDVKERGKTEVDAKCLAVAPGFIDAHTHSESQVFLDPSRLCKLRQGVTTEIGGQCGWSYGPIDENATQEFYDYVSAVKNDGVAVTMYFTFEELMDAVEGMRPGTHQMSFVGHHALRGSVVGMEDRPATDAEIERMQKLLDCAMREGALGLSTGLVYAPGIYSSTEELIALASIVAKYGGIYTTHMRNEGDGLLASVEEVIRIAKEAKVRVNISHMKVMYQKNRPLLDKALKRIQEANEEGCDIFFDVYPYAASSATILSTLPPSYLTRGMDWLVSELRSTEGVARLEKAIMEPMEAWENPLLNVGFDHDLIVVAPQTPDAVGKFIHDYALEKGLRDVEAYAHIIAENRGAVKDIRFLMDEEDLTRLYQNPLCVLGTDGLYAGGTGLTHPRGMASFPRFLGKYIREKKILPREEGIRRITGLTADRYGLQTKGYIRVGYDADLVLFDFEHIMDHATYLEPFRVNEGIEMVFVGGMAAVVNNRPTGVYNGKVYKRTTC